MATTKKRVLLFKKQDTKLDQYNEQLLKNNYIPQFIPVLTHKTDNLDKIQHILQQGPSQFNALILTSQRSVQALSEAYQQVEFTEAVKEEWNQLPIYIVGPHTASLLQELPLFTSEEKQHWTIAPRAAELIKPLIHDFQQHKQEAQLLFLAGDKRRDLIPTKLNEAGIHFHEIQSYFTCIHPDLSDSLTQLLQLTEKQQPDWIVYFSPSGLKFVLEATPRFHKSLASSVNLAAIGPTTANAILEQLHTHPHVTAEKPDAHHLVEAIKQFHFSA